MLTGNRTEPSMKKKVSQTYVCKLSSHLHPSYRNARRDRLLSAGSCAVFLSLNASNIDLYYYNPPVAPRNNAATSPTSMIVSFCSTAVATRISSHIAVKL